MHRLKDLPRVTPFLWIIPVIGLAVVGAYGLALGDWMVAAIAAVVAAAAFAVGVLLGFLFGIPRALTAENAPAGTPDTVAVQYTPNTNLEQISDWFTKILLGAGLVQLGELRGAFADLVTFLKPALGGDDAAEVFALGATLYFAIGGFLCGYLITRVVLQGELNDATADAAVRYNEATVRAAAKKASAQETV